MRFEGHDVCKTRTEMRRLLPDDDQIMPPCEACAAAAVAAMTAEQEDWLRTVESANNVVCGPW